MAQKHYKEQLQMKTYTRQFHSKPRRLFRQLIMDKFNSTKCSNNLAMDKARKVMMMVKMNKMSPKNQNKKTKTTIHQNKALEPQLALFLTNMSLPESKILT
jgi:hypothetical protein